MDPRWDPTAGNASGWQKRQRAKGLEAEPEADQANKKLHVSHSQRLHETICREQFETNMGYTLCNHAGILNILTCLEFHHVV